MQCASCSFEAASEFAFCPKCGARLDALPQQADRRPATVLFADLCGFTALGEQLDPEDVRALQTDLFAEMRAALQKYDGFVEKYVGDAVMAVFGAPVAHEDDPERSLRAALEMHARVAALNGRWEKRLGRKLALHVGVNTGRVVAGNLGAGSSYAVTGDAVNTAARLQSAAQAGQTLVSQSTYLLARHRFAFEAGGELSLKGKAAPLEVYRLMGVEEGSTRTSGLKAFGLSAPLIGRGGELERMRAAFQQGLTCHAQVLCLSAEAGAGKTRLLEEFLECLGAQERPGGLTLRRTSCSSMGEQPYGVLASFIREGYGIASGDALEVAEGKIRDGLRSLGASEADTAGVGSLLGCVLGLQQLDPRREIEPERLKRQIWMMLRTVFEQHLAQGPLLLVVEDLHWADAASIEGLRAMMDWLAERPLLLVFTCRPTFDPKVFAQGMFAQGMFAQGMFAQGRAPQVEIRLGPLPEASVEMLLGALFGASCARIPAALRATIIARAGGNPFHVEEILRGLIAEGVLVRDADGWRCSASADTARIPPTIEGLLLSRVDRLPPGARRYLQEAAVLGTVFDPALVRLVSSHSGARDYSPLALPRLQENSAFLPGAADAAASLALLREAEFVEAFVPTEQDAKGEGAQRCRFTHALVQEVVYQNLLLSQRTQLHGRAAQALEQLHGSRPKRLEDLGQLGHHLSLSEARERGAGCLAEAGDWARSLYANDDALRYYQRALETLRQCPGSEQRQAVLVERLGDVLALVGRRAEALERYESVLRSAGQAGTQARLLRKLGSLHWDAGERERAHACFERGLALLADQSAHIELAQLYQEMGRLAFRSGDNAGALGWAGRAQEESERVAARASEDDGEAKREAATALAQALTTLGAALARLGREREAVQHVERSIAVAVEHGLLQAACRGYANLGVLYATLEPQRAIDTCLAGLATAQKIGDLGFQSRLYANLAVAYCALTDRCDIEGLKAAEAAIDLDRQLGQLDHLAVPLIVLAQIHHCHGEPERALRYYEEARTLAEQIGEPQLLFPCYDGLAAVYLERGERELAERYLMQAEQVCERAGGDRDSLVVLPFLC